MFLGEKREGEKEGGKRGKGEKKRKTEKTEKYK